MLNNLPTLSLRRTVYGLNVLLELSVTWICNGYTSTINSVIACL